MPILKEKAKVIMLPTKDYTHIKLDSDGVRLWYDNRPTHTDIHKHQHLYLVTDEEIKEGDWFIANQGVHICVRIDKEDTQYPYVTINSKGDIIKHSRHWNTKIIATTDMELFYGDEVGYAEHLPQIPQDFIEKYVKEYNEGNIITDILVEHEKKCNLRPKDCEYSGCRVLNQCGNNRDVNFLLKVSKDNTITIHHKDSWNREEVENLLIKALNHEGYNTEFGRKKDNENWIKENLK